MKAKMKFDQAKVKEFLVAHVEKIVFGGFVVVFLLFAYGAVSKKPYTETPDGFNRVSDEKKLAIDNAKAPHYPVPQPPVELPAVQSVAYKLTGPFHTPQFDTRKRRNEPVYFAVEDLHVGVGVGALAYVALQDPNVVNGVPPVGARPGGPPGRFGVPAGKGMGKGMGMNMGEFAAPGQPGKGRAAGKVGMGGKAGGRFGNAPAGPGGEGGGRFGVEGGGRFDMEGGGRFGRQAMMPQAPLDDPDAEQFVLPVAPAGSEVKGRQWAVITGLVPVMKQAAEYRLKFSNALMTDPNMDVPHYVGFKVQRAEIKTGTADKDLVWQDVDVNKALLDMQDWMQYPVETVDPLYLSEICQPLPALVGKNFDKSVAHPRIPLVPVIDPLANGFVPGREGEMRQRFNGPPGVGMGMNMGGDRFGGIVKGGGMGGKAMGGMGGRFGPGGMGGGRFGEGDMTGMPTVPIRIEYQLFRFFDFSVVPGKKYRYQVRLELVNPNYGFLAPALESLKLAVGETRETPWSAPSPQASIPHGSHLLASKVTPARGPVEQKVEVLVRNWNPKRAIVALQTRNLMRGEVVNFSTEAIVDDPMTGLFRKEPDVVFDTNSVLVDMVGGESMDTGTSKVAAPVEILVLGPDGELFVRSQVTDADELASGMKEFQRRKDKVTEPDPNTGVPVDAPVGDTETPTKGGKPMKQKSRFGGR